MNTNTIIDLWPLRENVQIIVVNFTEFGIKLWNKNNKRKNVYKNSSEKLRNKHKISV